MTISQLRVNLSKEISSTVVIRSYNENGNSVDTRRPTTETERETLYHIIDGALIAASVTTDSKQRRGIASAAECIATAMIHGCNGYDTAFNPLLDAFKHLDAIRR